MSRPQDHLGGAERLPAERLGSDRCRECGRPLGAGYLCDDCDSIEIVDTAEPKDRS